MTLFARLRQKCITEKQGLACAVQKCTYESCFEALRTQPSGLKDPDKDAYYPDCQIYLDALTDCMTREAARGGDQSGTGGQTAQGNDQSGTGAPAGGNPTGSAGLPVHKPVYATPARSETDRNSCK